MEDWQAPPPPSVDPNIPASTAPNSNSGGVDGSISSVGGTEVEPTPGEGEDTTFVTAKATIRNEAGRFNRYRRFGSGPTSLWNSNSEGPFPSLLEGRLFTVIGLAGGSICVTDGCKRNLLSVRHDKHESLRTRQQEVRVSSGPLEDWVVQRYGKDSTGPNGSHWHGIIQRRDRDDHGNLVGLTSVDVYKPVDRWNVAARRFGNGDYLTFGYWLDYDMMEDTRSSRWDARPENVRYLVFAESETTRVDVSALQGTATYEGQSTGVMQWNEDGSRRISTFEKAPVMFIADFADNSINGEVILDHNAGKPVRGPFSVGRLVSDFYKVGGNFYQYPDGVDPAQTGSDLSGWHKIAPGRVYFEGGKINDEEGTFNFATSGVEDGVVRVIDNPSRPGHPVDADQGLSKVEGDFIRPQDGMPQWLQGIFAVESVTDGNSGSFYRIEGAFGAKEE